MYIVQIKNFYTFLTKVKLMLASAYHISTFLPPASKHVSLNVYFIGYRDRDCRNLFTPADV